MKVVICNMGYSGYWVACWRELMKHVELVVITPQTRYPYSEETTKGLPIRILSAEEMDSPSSVAKIVVVENPDVLVVGGWTSRVFSSLVYHRSLQSVTKVLIVDSAWEGSWRQIFSRFRLWRYVRQFDGIIVGGERGRKFARWIGFRADKIFRSIYGYDADAFKTCHAKRMMKSSWPRRFCFVGRLVPVKGLSVLKDAYGRYRERVANPWPLDCYGTGILMDSLGEEEGVTIKGFLDPCDLPQALVGEGVFIFPSLREPWGVALVEAAGAGLPIICSDMVTSGDDVVRQGRNGYIVKTGDAKSLCKAMIAMHSRYAELPQMGEESMRLAKDFSPMVWCRRWMEAFHALGR